ncbi:MAG: hypothetical protein QW331_04650 [Candidatus Woesearchaeota archaeon]
MKPKQQKMNWKQKFLAIAIAIVFAMFVYFGISTFYVEPEFNYYCKPELISEYINTSERCNQIGGRWQANYPKPIYPEAKYEGYCDVYAKCQEEYNKVKREYRKNVFAFAVLFGVIALVAGIFINVSTVAGGLMGGGIITMIWGTIQYWEWLADMFRFIILGIVLIILIWVGWKKLK